jgi:amino acid transporter/mannitol/fructose-specific phosphotransferase system IIA component (Ntr-type)
MELKKEISVLGVFSIATGAMISSGIFILPGLAFSKVGPAVFVSYFIAGLLGLLGILSIIELSTAMPKAGGDFYFINKSLGPLFGTISGFLGWFTLSLKSAFAIFGISEIVYLYTSISPLITSLVLCLLFVVMNIIGVKEAAIFQIIMVVGLLSLIFLYIIISLPKINMAYFSPFLTGNYNDILITAGFVFISFGGLLNIANISEEVVNPKRNIPLGMLASIIVVTILYTIMTFIITGTLSPADFSQSLTPVADSAGNTMGTIGYIMIIAASLLAFFTTANAGIMSASRYPMALSRDQLLPPKIATINKRYKTPVISIVITGAIIYLSLLLPLEMLVKSASTVILTSYVLSNLSVIILRESRIRNYQPSFKTPFYPWIQIVSIIIFVFFIIDLGLASIEISISILILSFVIYLFYGKKNKHREYALLHVMRRIADSRLMDNLLEDELREVIVNRDNIEQDNFDNLIKKAHIIDIDEPLDYEGLIKKVAKDIAQKISMGEDEIISRFIKRQEESSTAISDFLAIPHIIIEGENELFLIIIRSKKGIRFSDKEDRIKAIFLLGGTQEKRILHLKTIAAIASLVGTKDFQEKWLTIDDFIELKNLMILNERKRFH